MHDPKNRNIGTVKKILSSIVSLLLLSGCTLSLEVKQIRTDLDALDRASSTVDQANSKINELNREINTK